MKKNLLFLMLIGIFISCSSNDDDPEETIIVEEMTINNSETFQYSLGYFGIEEGVYIQKQPGNSELSEIIRNDASGDLIYRRITSRAGIM